MLSCNIGNLVDSLVDRNSKRKKCLLLEFNKVAQFLLFRMKYIIDGGPLFYLIIDPYYYFIIPTHE